jgi:hypothetical protein
LCAGQISSESALLPHKCGVPTCGKAEIHEEASRASSHAHWFPERPFPHPLTPSLGRGNRDRISITWSMDRRVHAFVVVESLRTVHGKISPNKKLAHRTPEPEIHKGRSRASSQAHWFPERPFPLPLTPSLGEGNRDRISITLEHGSPRSRLCGRMRTDSSCGGYPRSVLGCGSRAFASFALCVYRPGRRGLRDPVFR